MASGIKFNPETIATALFALLQTTTFPFTTYSRKGAIWGDVPSANQPYLALLPADFEGVQNQAIALEKWTLGFSALVYIRADADPDTIPATEMNAALLAISEAIAGPVLGERNTLGGLVNNVWINGKGIMDPGIFDQQCAIWIPISVDVGV